mgnify:CR=1 FL=1
MKKVDRTWSIKHEGHLNKNNIIFRDDVYIKLVERIKSAGPRKVDKNGRTI